MRKNKKYHSMQKIILNAANSGLNSGKQKEKENEELF
jgi:hypothetical protein